LTVAETQITSMPNFHGDTYNKQAHAETINKTREPLNFKKKLLPALYYDGARHDTHIFGCGSCDVLKVGELLVNHIS
jgi:hypothetical protein